MDSPFHPSLGNPPRRSVFDDDSDDDNAKEDLYHSRPNIADLDSHPAAGPSVSQNIGEMSSPAVLHQDDFSTTGVSSPSALPSYSTPVRHPPASRPYDSPANDPWSSTPHTNGVIPNTVPSFPHRTNTSILPPSSARGETASYLLDADHISIQKSDEKEGIIGFKHINYTLASARRGTQVVRRYSDFAWYDFKFPVLTVLGCQMFLPNGILSDRSRFYPQSVLQVSFFKCSI
jgi:hypothetical protein